MNELVRSYAHEAVVSRSFDFYRNLVIAVGSLAIMSMLGLDLIDRTHNIYYLRTMLGAIVGGGFIVSMLRYSRYFVDEVRTGPEYLVARRGDMTAVIPIALVAHVSLNHFATPYFGIAHVLPRIQVQLTHACAFGSVIAFCPQTDWRERWTRGPMQNMLRAAENASLI